jgi:hypothetical protein
MPAADMRWRHGSCHCGAVAFEVLAADDIDVVDCNCSVCRMSGFQHLIVAAERFRLISGQDKLTTYTFNTGTARHLFCAACGIKSFYVPRSHPDGYSVNVRCLDAADFRSIRIRPFDGQNWEQHVAALPSLEAN